MPCLICTGNTLEDVLTKRYYRIIEWLELERTLRIINPVAGQGFLSETPLGHLLPYLQDQHCSPSDRGREEEEGRRGLTRLPLGYGTSRRLLRHP